MFTKEFDVNVECIDERFSTTRRLTKNRPNSPNLLSDVFSNLDWSKKNRSNANEGGLRTIGLFKSQKVEPIITVITVTMNDAQGLEETILSVLNQTYSNIEYLIIDGGSNDKTLDVLHRYDHAIDYWVSEPDRGIYDAMNKGLRVSTGDWINFLNAKDRFCRSDTIHAIASNYLQSDAKFIYSDVLLTAGSSKKETLVRYNCNHERLIINHQASVYHKSLHSDYGLYLVAPGVTISDYIFFSQIDRTSYLKINEPIAVYDTTGLSQSKRSSEQKFIVDYLINRLPKSKFLFYFICFRFLHKIKLRVTRVLNFFSGAGALRNSACVQPYGGSQSISTNSHCNSDEP
jgi:glycosyltransferase involved in cell wall biosynthesis